MKRYADLLSRSSYIFGTRLYPRDLIFIPDEFQMKKRMFLMDCERDKILLPSVSIPKGVEEEIDKIIILWESSFSLKMSLRNGWNLSMGLSVPYLFTLFFRQAPDNFLLPNAGSKIRKG